MQLLEENPIQTIEACMPQASNSPSENQHNLVVRPTKESIDLGGSEFIARIANYIESLSKEEQRELVCEILKYSLEDAFQLAGRIGFSDEERLKLIQSNFLRDLYPKFSEEFSKEYLKVKSSLSQLEKNLVNKTKNGEALNTLSSVDTELVSDLIFKHYDLINDGRVLKSISSDKQKENFSPLVQLVLNSTLKAYLPHYYVKKIFDDIRSVLELDKNAPLDSDFKAKGLDESIIYKLSITEDEVRALSKAYNLDENQYLKKANLDTPLNITYNLSKALAVKELEKEVQAEIANRLAVSIKDVVIDENSDIYVKGEKLKANTLREDLNEIKEDIKERNEVRVEISADKKGLQYNPAGEYIYYYQDGEETVIVQKNWEYRFKTNDLEEPNFRNVKPAINFFDGQICELTCKPNGHKVVLFNGGIQTRGKIKSADKYNIFEGKLCFEFSKNIGDRFVFFDGKTFGPYKHVEDIQYLDSRLVFKAKRIDESSEFFVVDGKEHKSYVSVSFPFFSSNNFVYIARSDVYERFLVINGVEQKEYQAINSLRECKGKLAYVALLQSGSETLVVDGKEVATYKSISGLQVVNDELCYCFNDNNGKKFFVKGDDEPKEIENLLGIQSFGSNLVLEIVDKFVNYNLIVNGNTHNKYESIQDIQAINGDVAYNARKKDGSYCLVEAGEEVIIGREDKIDFKVVSGKITYVDFGSSTSRKTLYHGKEEIIVTSAAMNSESLTYQVDLPSGKAELVTYEYNKNKDFSLTKSEERKLRLISLLKKGSITKNELELLKELNKEEKPKEFSFKDRMITLAQRLGVLKDPNTKDKLVSSLVNNLFPSLREKRREKLKEESGFNEIEETEGNLPIDQTFFEQLKSLFTTFFQPKINNKRLGSGNPLRDQSSPNFSTDYKGMSVSDVFGEYDFNTQSWTPLNVNENIVREQGGELKKYSFKIKTTLENGEATTLYAPINSKLARKFLSKGQILPKIQTSKEYIKYQAKVSKTPSLGRNVSWDQYRKYFGDTKLMTDLAPNNKHLDKIAKSLIKSSPLKTAAAIEAYVREIFYYDDLNGELTEKKSGLDPESLVAFAKKRTDDLAREGYPVKGKIYSGVCSDASLITTVLLRKAGLASSVLSGYSGTTPHTKSYFLMPAKKSSGKIIVELETSVSELEDSEEFDNNSIESLSDLLSDLDDDDLALEAIEGSKKNELDTEIDSILEMEGTDQKNQDIVLSYYVFNISNEEKLQIANLINYICFSGRKELGACDLKENIQNVEGQISDVLSSNDRRKKCLDFISRDNLMDEALKRKIRVAIKNFSN